MFGSLFDETVSLVRRWEPAGEYRNENDYRDDLMDFLRDKLNGESSFGLGPQKRVKVASESGRSLCDIAVDEKIGIELKKDLRQLGKTDRLMGQLGRRKGDYEDLIVVLVGRTDRNAFEDLVSRIEEITGSEFSFGLQRGPRIELIDKGSGTNVKKRPPFDFGF